MTYSSAPQPEPGQRRRSGRWLFTRAHLSAVLVAAVGVLIGVIGGRPDALVVIAPLVIIVIWSIALRPTGSPSAEAQVARGTVPEGQSNAVVISTEGVQGAELVAASLAATAWIRRRPEHGAVVELLDPSGEQEASQLTIGADPERWGNRSYGTALVGVVGAWGAYSWGPLPLASGTRRMVPAAEVFDNGAPAPHPRGLVGHHRSARAGQGSEFNSIRPFQWGDRLKRINWPRSTRTGELHVTSSYADQDTHVALIVDAQNDLGGSEGYGGKASTLDRAVRSAAAIGEHFTAQGDRVSLQVISGALPVRLSPGTGGKHFRRLLDVLATAVPSPERKIDPERVRLGITPGTLVVIVSSLVSEAMFSRAAALAHSGITVVAIDVLGDSAPDYRGQPEHEQLAWRLRMLERDREIRRVQQAGAAVVPWRGPGSLDLILRQLARRGRAGAM
ncbi:DUF58 domain-containing protein [Nesterenkonia sp. MY13]|uniref:DUF58 domain-containing protein n=1 Tax=Nesterenkonia sedimenti TaxID=1463632 RepID=A0A7X8THX6_9MICC|nr:DUF58 domain-containing protein [Nesterenkonia sedimenti]NLS09044.1 DUF58 domain-containing protein [Nesterenkonia sedimenti]